MTEEVSDQNYELLIDEQKGVKVVYRIKNLCNYREQKNRLLVDRNCWDGSRRSQDMGTSVDLGLARYGIKTQRSIDEEPAIAWGYTRLDSCPGPDSGIRNTGVSIGSSTDSSVVTSVIEELPTISSYSNTSNKNPSNINF